MCFRILFNDVDYCCFKESVVESGLVVSRGDYPVCNLVRFEYLFCEGNVRGNTIVHGLKLVAGIRGEGVVPFEDDQA